MAGVTDQVKSNRTAIPGASGGQRALYDALVIETHMRRLLEP